MKTTQEYVSILQASAQELRTRFGITSLKLFGSVARGEQTEGSDVDVLVDMPASMKQVCGAQLYLEEKLGCSVDLIRNHNHLSAFFLNQVARDGIAIY